MRSLIVFLLFIPLLALTKSSRRILPDIMAPQTFEVRGNILAMCSGVRVAVLTLSDLETIAQFGSRGEGPGEFMPEDRDMGLTLFFQNDTLLVTSRGKISRFTKEGRFLDQIRTVNGFSHKPLGNGFVGLNTVLRDKIVFHIVTLFDRHFKIQAEMGSKRFWFQREQDIDAIDVSIPRICTQENRVFFQNASGNIDIADQHGKRIASTQVAFRSRPVTEEDRQIYIAYYKNHPIYKEYYANLRQYITFPTHFPPLKFFDVSDSLIYLFTYQRKNGRTRIYICDLAGNVQKQLDQEMPEIDPFEVYPLIRVSRGTIYQIKEDGEDMVLWETKIEQ